MSEIENNFDAMFNTNNESVENSMPTTNEVESVTKNEIASPETFEIKVNTSALGSLGITPIAFGDKIRNIPIEKYKAKMGKIDKISIISSDVLPIKYHYIDGKGSFLCTGGRCCELSGDPTIRYIVPVCVYDTNSRGDFSSPNLELKVLSMGNELYQTVTMIANTVKNMGGITHVDLNVNCTDDKFQKLTLIPSGEAMWRKSADAVQFLATKWNESVGEAYRAIARSVDEDTFVKFYEEANFGVKDEPKFGANDNHFGNVSQQTSNFDDFFKK